MKSIIIPNVRFALRNQPALEEITKGLIVIAAGPDQDWAASVIFGVVGVMKSRNIETAFLSDLNDNYYYESLDGRNKTLAGETMNFYGNLRSRQILETALDSARERITMGVMHAFGESIVRRMTDMRGEDALFEEILKCTISYGDPNTAGYRNA